MLIIYIIFITVSVGLREHLKNVIITSPETDQRWKKKFRLGRAII